MKYSEKRKLQKHIQFLKDMKNVLISMIRKESNQFFKYQLGQTFRHLHIAHCLLKGRDISVVETRNRQYCSPKEKLYKSLMALDGIPDKNSFYSYGYDDAEKLVSDLQELRKTAKKIYSNPFDIKRTSKLMLDNQHLYESSLVKDYIDVACQNVFSGSNEE